MFNKMIRHCALIITGIGVAVLSLGTVVTEDVVLDEVDVGDDVESVEDEVVVTAVELCEVALLGLCTLVEAVSVRVVELEEVDDPVVSKKKIQHEQLNPRSPVISTWPDCRGSRSSCVAGAITGAR